MKRRSLDRMVPPLVFGALIGLALLGWWLIFQAPMVWQLDSLRVTAGERPVVIGHRELGQRPGSGRSAALNHLRLEYRDDRWWLANVSAHKRVDAPSAQRSTRFVRRWRLAPGDRIALPADLGRQELSIKVESVDAETLQLATPDGQRARWEGGRLQTARPAFDGCPEQGARWWLRLLDPWRHRELSLFSIGGQVDCPRRWRLNAAGSGSAALPVDSLRVLWADGAFWLAPGSADVKIRLQGVADPRPRGFEDLQLAIGNGPRDAQRVYLGRSGFRLETVANASGDGHSDLLLTPIAGGDVWLKNEARPIPRDPRVQANYQLQRWVGGGVEPRQWLEAHPLWSGGVLLLSLLSLLRYLRARRRRRATPAAALVPVSILGLGLSLGLWLRPDADVRWLFWLGWLGWAWSSVVLLEAKRLRGYGGGLWLLGLLLTASGAIVLGQLAAGGDSGRWLGFAIGHWGLWAAFGWGLGLLAPVTAHSWRFLLLQAFTGRASFWGSLRLLLPLVLALVLLAQLAVGREQGLAGIQPVEGAKLLLVFLLAFAGMRLMELREVRGGAYREHRLLFLLRVTAFALLFWLFADVLLWAVHDMSPVLILGLLMVALLWKLAPAPTLASGRGPQHSFGGLLLRMVLLVGVAGLVVPAARAWLHPELLPTWLPQYERFQVWADPATHPHSGMQVLMAMDLAGSGGWWGALPSWWGWNGSVMRLPAVQDDFITAFLLFRFGGAPALLLLAVQLLFLWAMFALGRCVAADWLGTERRAGRGISLVLYGLAWLFAAHWIIAWANVLGLLPVMGQPMTWLAAGNSHLLLFGYPALSFALLVSWSSDRGH